MSSITVQDFPQELLDHIISFLKDDKYSLSNCTLISHAWLDSSRRLLFKVLSVVVWKDGGDIVSFTSRITHSPECGLGLHVRQLTLDDIPLTRRFVKDRFPMNGHTMSIIMDILPNLKALELKSLVFGPLSPFANVDVLPTYRKHRLERLIIHVIGTEDPDLTVDCFLDCLNVFSEIDELEILPYVEDSRATDHLDEPRMPTPKMPVIHKILLSFPYLSNGIFGGVVIQALSHTSLTTVSIRGCATGDQFKSVGALLINAASTVRHIEFEFFSWQMLRPLQDAPRDFNTLNLPLCTSLQTLTINRLAKSLSDGAPSIDVSVLNLLALAPRTIRTISIRAFSSAPQYPSKPTPTSDADLESAKALRAWDWRGLRAELEKRVKEELEEIVFVSWGELMGEETRDVVRDGLGVVIRDKGALKFEVATSMNWA